MQSKSVAGQRKSSHSQSGSRWRPSWDRMYDQQSNSWNTGWHATPWNGNNNTSSTTQWQSTSWRKSARSYQKHHKHHGNRDHETSDGGTPKQRLTRSSTPICYRCGYAWCDHSDHNLGPYKKWCLRRSTAGALACFIDKDSNEPHFLFGEEPRKDGGYNIFWGFGEMGEAFQWETAARECKEETLGLLQPGTSLSALGSGICETELTGASHEVPIFIISLGLQSRMELARNYQRRRHVWQSSLTDLKALAPVDKQAGGDIMTGLFSVKAKDFLYASSCSADGVVALGPLHAETFSREVVRTQAAVLLPRPPVREVASALSSPCNAAAEWLRAFCNDGTMGYPSSSEGLYAIVAPDVSEIVHGITIAGTPSGDTIATQTLFSMCWTGPDGCKTPRRPSQLAPLVAPMLCGAQQVNLYIEKLVFHALDSPGIARLVEEHFVALTTCSSQMKEFAIGMLPTLLVVEVQRILQRLQQASREDESVAVAYRLLTCLRFVRCLQNSLLPEQQMLDEQISEAESVANFVVVEILASAPKHYWLSAPALETLLLGHEDVNNQS